MAAILPILTKGRSPLIGLLALGMGGSFFGGGGTTSADSTSNWLLPAIVLPALAKG